LNSIFYAWSGVLILSLSVTGLAIRFLADQKIPLAESLVVRGLVCLVLVIGWSLNKNLSLKPKSVSTQIFRALIAGLALTFFSMSYNWLSASTIAVLSNIDVPLLVILGSWVGQRSSARAKFLSVISVSVLVIYTLTLHKESNWILGLSTLGLGCFLLCFGYFFIKKSMAEENEAITVLTPSLALIAYGGFPFAVSLFSGDVSSTINDSLTHSIPSVFMNWNQSSVGLCLLSGVGMFGAYYATMRLYEHADIATAEFPTLISSIFIQPMEAFLFRESLSLPHLILSIVFVGIVHLILKSENKVPAMTFPQVPQSLDFTCGPACFDSMFRYFRKDSPGELRFAEQLGTLASGYTDPAKLVDLARTNGFQVLFQRHATIKDVYAQFSQTSVLFVTWWYEDSGHYSLVKHIDEKSITLMDPWEARAGKDNMLKLMEFETHWQARGGILICVSDGR
jgi:drug/metabolite transporter (DMT)-like permease/predicted double-glycine peptidase